MADATTERAAEVRVYREPLPEIRKRMPVNVVRAMRRQWCASPAQRVSP
jgi:hypothetical protein